jgi:tetrahydromethanopterin S-methyltransferase subunit E
LRKLKKCCLEFHDSKGQSRYSSHNFIVITITYFGSDIIIVSFGLTVFLIHNHTVVGKEVKSQDLNSVGVVFKILLCTTSGEQNEELRMHHRNQTKQGKQRITW